MSQLQKSFYVIPAKAGIQSFQYILDPGFRRSDRINWFCKWLRCNCNTYNGAEP
jgi:hypothetical protein